MDQELLKTSKNQRIIIGAIAVLMLGSMIASYAAIVLSRGEPVNNDIDPEIQAIVAKYEDEYREKTNALVEASRDFYNEFVGYKSEIKAFNAASANEAGVETRDLKVGYGRAIGDGDTNYLAYYVGWCPDETVFDSSFDDAKKPTKFDKIIDPEVGLIEGWSLGVAGMKTGGIREITIPGELAYGDTREICGGYNTPLKFMVMAVDKTESLNKIATELDTVRTKIQYAYYGIDYDKMMNGDSSESEPETTPEAE